jgi:hypothetical protein
MIYHCPGPDNSSLRELNNHSTPKRGVRRQKNIIPPAACLLRSIISKHLRLKQLSLEGELS